MILADRMLARAKRRHGEDSQAIRTAVGIQTGIVGVTLNVLLALAKLIVGVLSHSMALITDGINNTSDAISSIVVIGGLKMAASPPDRDHPYGHGRIEYVAGLVVSFMVLAMGLQFLWRSGERVFYPVALEPQKAAVPLMILAMVVKIWMYFFYHAIAKKTNHMALEAAATDSRGDALITAVVLIAYVVGSRTSWPVDGLIGVLVSVFIIYAGVELVKETVSPLIGEAADAKLLEAIKNRAEAEPLVLGTHDLFVYHFSPDHIVATMDVEFDANLSLMEVHDVMDRIEAEICDSYGIDLVLHMDPRYVLKGREKELFRALEAWVDNQEELINIHDFRKRLQEDGSHIFCFDLKVDGEKSQHLEKLTYYQEEARRRIDHFFPGHAFYMNVDIAFPQEKKIG